MTKKVNHGTICPVAICVVLFRFFLLFSCFCLCAKVLLKVPVMVCVCCRCCVCFKRSHRKSGDSEDDAYDIPGAKHIPKPVNRPRLQKSRVKQHRSVSHDVYCSVTKNSQVQNVSSPASVASFWNVPLDVDVVPLETKPFTVSIENLPWIDDDGTDPDCCRQKRKPGFRPLRGSSAPSTGTKATPTPTSSSSLIKLEKSKKKAMDKRANGGGFFQRWFGGSAQSQQDQNTASTPSRTTSPYRDENDYATIDRLRFGKRECHVLMIHLLIDQLRIRQRCSASASTRSQGTRSTQQSLTQLDEATLDLLRLSCEPDNTPITLSSSKRINPAADYLPKAASTSSVNKAVRTRDGGNLRPGDVFTWAADDDTRAIDHRLGNVSDVNRVHSSFLSPQMNRRNEFVSRSVTGSEFVDERQAYGLSPQPSRRRIEDIDGDTYTLPSNGFMGESPIGSPLTKHRQTGTISPASSRRTETIIDYEQKKRGPPVDGGNLRLGNVFTWAAEDGTRAIDHRLGDVSDVNRVHSSFLSPQMNRRNDFVSRSVTGSEFVDERQAYGLSPQQSRRRIEDIDGDTYTLPSNGFMGESPIGSPLAKHRQTGTISPASSRRTETIIDYEQKKRGPPVVRTTVEGKLKMEKIVGADLITVDSCVSSAWTVRDTVTNYKIKDGHSRFKITLIENGETKMEREATLEIPDFMNKKDYLTEVGQRLLKDLREDDDAVSAVTHVEVETIEDVTNILKTYVIGEQADDYTEEELVDALHYEVHTDRTPSPIEQKRIEKIYIDSLTVDEESHDLEKAEINILQEGHHFEDEGRHERVRRLESDESDEIITEVMCINAVVDCCLVKREDSSNFTVHIAVPLIQTISMILTRRRAHRREDFSKTVQIEQFEDEARKREQQLEEVVQKTIVHDVSASKNEKDAEADGGKYEMELQGQKLTGNAVIKRRMRTVDSESSEELPTPKTIVIQETNARGGQYGMEMEGVTLRGEKMFRHRSKKYESESEDSMHWDAGSPTIVDLIKKESDSFFDVVFETSNNYEPQAMCIRRVVIKTESCEMNSAFLLPKDNTEEVSVVLKTKTKSCETFCARELGEQYSSVIVSLQNFTKPGEKEKSAEKNLATVSHTKVQCSFREIIEEQAMMLCKYENISPITGEALILRREKNRHQASFYTSAAEIEHVTIQSVLNRLGDMLECQRSLKTPNVISNSAKLKEISIEYATNVLFLQKMHGIQDLYADATAKDKHIRNEFLRTRATSETSLMAQYALTRRTSFPLEMSTQTNIKTANISSSSFRSCASESRMISATLMFSKGVATQTTAIKVSDSNRQNTTTNIAEYGQVQEHCAVMLKNTGGIHGITSAALAEAVTGEFLIDIDTRTTNKNFHLTNYKTLLPPRGEAQILWPLAVLISASFHLSKLSEHCKLSDENIHQDLRIRRKDVNVDVTVYFLYKRVFGNFAMASLGIHLVEKVQKIYEQQLNKEVLRTSNEFYDTYTRHTMYSDKILQTTTVEDRFEEEEKTNVKKKVILYLA
ncbi:hypothetical protein DICVIV_07872 [Dictyocaulus viviparus]|uniref:Uncharacterized protein n=1 Tax=Dictyocaulus viviparus TaxID=29172 RepID=A0A0D8XQN1_DICVI|nr:hypothetical protein DICVIV_07872 [Dictyocaulus viviparus]